MPKVKINKNAFVYPMPVVLVGAAVDGKPNFMPVGWISRVNHVPPMIGAGMHNSHYTNKGIHEHQQFSVNIPSKNMLLVTDYCGLVSGAKVDKSGLFTIFSGEIEHAPMIEECAITMECKLVQALDLGSNTWFIGEIVGAYCSEDCLTDGKPDIKKIEPFTLTMPDNNYWLVGEHAGRAWWEGKGFTPKG